MSSSNELTAAATAYLFVILPFIALVILKGSTNDWIGVLTSNDWSIAGAMIYSSSAIAVSSATRRSKGTTNEIKLENFVAVSWSWAVVNVLFYAVSHFSSNYYISIIQITLFIIASLHHFKCNRAIYRLDHQPS